VTGAAASYALGAVGSPDLRIGGELGADGPAWAQIESALPAEGPDSGASAAVDFDLDPMTSATFRFVLAWHAPTWKGGGYNTAKAGNTFTHIYAKHTRDARHAAETLAGRHEELLKRVLGWQAVVYADEALPVWPRDSLVNILYLIPETGLWAHAGPPLPDWVRPEDGLFGMNECPRDCPQIECIPCSFYGNIPLVYFFPELALSTLRGYAGYQDADGAPPWIFGGCTTKTPPIDFAEPTRGYQVTLNVPC
jgi:uncharacterized protein (DUF608 family)